VRNGQEEEIVVTQSQQPGPARARLAALACVAALAFAACGGSSSTAAPAVSAPASAAASQAASQAPSPAASAAATNQTFTYASHTQVVTDLDPATSYSNEVIAMHDIYESLTYYDAVTKKVMPALATSWTSSPDGKTWTFTLRTGVTFHTGRVMDAAAAKAAIERTKTINQGAGYIWGAVSNIVAKDPQTLVFTLDYAAPLDLIASANYAAYIYDTQAAGAPATGSGASDAALVAWFKTGKDAGTGPYTIASWKPGDEFELTLSKYDAYWGGWQAPHYTQVVYRVVPEVTTAAQLAQSGDVSYVDRLTPQLIASLKGNASLQVVETPSFQNLVALLNTASGPLKDPNIRKAVAKAFDVNGIVTALGGSVVAAKGVIPPGLIGYSDSLTGTGLDLAGAASLLAASGYGPSGKPLTLTATIVSGDTDLQLVTTSLKSNLAKLNVTLNVQALQWQAQWDEAKSSDVAKRQDVFLMYWWPDYADPFSWFISLFHSESTPNFNLAYYSNPKLDAEIDGIQALEATNRDAADAEYVTMQQQLIDDAVVVVPYVQNYQRVLQASVGGFVDNPAYAQVVFAYNLTPGP
jgi:peptide/nickel transport system substrate-binding protein